MLRKLLILMLLLAGGFSKAADMAGYVPTDAFTLIPADYKYELSKPQLVIKNMPRVRSQGPLPACYGCSAATIIQKYICDNHPAYLGKNCSQLPPTMEVSMFDMISWSLTNKDGQSKDLPSNHKNIRLKEEDRRKTEGVMVLVNSRGMPEYLTEACSTSSVLERGFADDVTKEVENTLSMLEEQHSQIIRNPSARCDACFRRFTAAFSSTIDEASFFRAFEKKTFGEVLYSLIFPKKCVEKISIRDLDHTVNIYPKINGPREREKLIATIIAAMGSPEKSRPVLVGNVCLLMSSNSDECLTHSLAVSGYKYLCKKPNLSLRDPDCILAMKVHNCWGDRWQRENDDGWVDAKKLIGNINRKVASLDDGTLSWIE